jgi:hypothetical protein
MTKNKFPRNDVMGKDKWTSLNSYFKKLVDYHKGVCNHTSLWDLSYVEKERFHLHCHFNKEFYDLIEAFLREKTIIVLLHTKDVNVEGDKNYSPPKQDKDHENEYMQLHDKQIDLQGDCHGTKNVNYQGAKDANN